MRQTERLKQLQRIQNMKDTSSIKLVKAKARTMLRALQDYTASHTTNLLITCDNKYRFEFYYRGTLIEKWDAVANVGTHVYAGALYDDTPSTKTQRKEIEKAIAEFRDVVFVI